MVADLNGGYVSECVGCWWKLDFCRGGKPYFEIMSTRVLGNHSNHYKLGCQSLVLMPVIVNAKSNKGYFGWSIYSLEYGRIPLSLKVIGAWQTDAERDERNSKRITASGTDFRLKWYNTSTPKGTNQSIDRNSHISHQLTSPPIYFQRIPVLHQPCPHYV